jgi:gliding motility-associated-like protein
VKTLLLYIKKNKILFISILFCAFSLSKVKAQTIDSVITTTAILCYGDMADVDVFITQTISPTPLVYILQWLNPAFGFYVQIGQTPLSPSTTTGTVQPFTNLIAGLYKIRLKNASGAWISGATFPFTVSQPDSLIVANVNSMVNNIDCFGDSTGSVDLTVSGGTPTYTYLWSNNSTNKDIYNLSEGLVTCTVNDSFGCESVVSFSITQQDEIISTPIIDGVSCFGGNNGKVVLNIIGGISAYNIDWYNADENNLSEGSYPYEITDANGCIFQDTVYVPQEDSLVLDIIAIDLQCNGNPTGEIDVAVISGGVGPFIYNWSGPNAFTSNQYIINNLYAGLYTLTVSDANNCNIEYQISVIEPITVSQDINFELSNYSTYGISCKNGSDGWISATPTGCYIPYTFDWTGPGGYFSNNQNITDLSEGLYNITVTNGLGCEEQFTFPINDPEYVLDGVVSSLYDYNGYDISCYGFNNGGILVKPNGGVAPYTFIWDNVQTLNPLVFQESGMHLLTMYDNNGCPWVSFIDLNQPDSLNWNTNMIPDTCEKEVGEIIIDVNGGILPYNYLWSDSQNSAIATQLFEGEYSVEVVDKNGCQIFDTISVTNLTLPKMDFAIMSDYERLYNQLKDPISFIDMTKLTWQKVLYWEWDFGDGTYGTDSIAFHSYQEIGKYDVLLKVTTDYNCIDTLRKEVVIEEYELFIPNAFTPNSINDNINDKFRPYGIGIDEFRMSIYSRWNELIYTTYNIEVGWNGKFENTGNECHLGVYVYYIETKDVFGAIHKYEGKINLMR